MRRRRWLGTGIVEEFDARQQRLLDLVLEQTRRYYRELHGTRHCHRHPLSLSRLMKLCDRGGPPTLMAVRVLTHSVDEEREEEPPLVYHRTNSERNPTHRPYRIFARDNHTHGGEKENGTGREN